MLRLNIYLFGPPRIELDNQIIAIKLRKALALLAYLAVTKQRHSRDTLATLFWPESNQRTARASLRRTLYEIGKMSDEPLLQTDDVAVYFHPRVKLWVDVLAFLELVDLSTEIVQNENAEERPVDSKQVLSQAEALYIDDFMEGFALSDCMEFAEWQFFQREDLRQTLRKVLLRLVELYCASGKFKLAIPPARRLLALDTLQESVHRLLMQLYAQADQQNAALRQYEECARILYAELALVPEDETVALLEAIRTKRFPAATVPMASQEHLNLVRVGLTSMQDQDQSSIEDVASLRTTLPRYITPFIGRQNEVEQLYVLLRDPHNRLVTVVGLGGVGKTRLVVEVAKKLTQDGACPLCFVNLQPVQSDTHFIESVAEALNLTLSGQETPRKQLLNHLRNQRMLLILDNFEQLLANFDDAKTSEGTLAYLTELMQTAPGLQMLITSRVVLNLVGEVVFALEGMLRSAGEGVPDQSADSDAVALFAQYARRARLTFSLEDERTSVRRICELVEGMPLATELAASWVRSLNCAEIVNEIEQNLDLLSTNAHNMPDRHRSMQVVFNQSWELLSVQEQTVFQQLCLFRSGFQRGAAEAITGATLDLLSALIDKSFIRRDSNERYQIHELLRQFGQSLLDLSQTDAEEAYEQHANYYVDYIHTRRFRIGTEEGFVASNEIESEIENIRQAWHWATRSVNGDALVKLGGVLSYYFDYRGRILLFLPMLEEAIASIRVNIRSKEAAHEISALLSYLGFAYLRVGRLAEAKEVFQESQTLFTPDCMPLSPSLAADPTIPIANPDLGLSMVANSQGDYEEALQIGIRVYDRCQGHKEFISMLFALYTTANARYYIGQIEDAFEVARQAHLLARKTKQRWFEGYVLNDLGIFAIALGDYVQAQSYAEESFRAKAQFHDREGMALALTTQAHVSTLTGDLQKAEDLYSQCVEMYRQIGDRGGLARALNGLGRTALLRNELNVARRHLSEALQIAANMEYWVLALSILYNCAELQFQSGHTQRAIQQLRFIDQHPSCDGDTLAMVSALIKRIEQVETVDESNLPPNPAKLEEMIASVLAQFAIER